MTKLAAIYCPTPGVRGLHQRRRCRAWARAEGHRVVGEPPEPAVAAAMLDQNTVQVVVVARHAHASQLLGDRVVVLEDLDAGHGSRLALAAGVGAALVTSGVAIGMLLSQGTPPPALPAAAAPATTVPPPASKPAPPSAAVGESEPAPEQVMSPAAVVVEVSRTAAPSSHDRPAEVEDRLPVESTSPPASSPAQVTESPVEPDPLDDVLCVDVDILGVIKAGTCTY